MREIGLLAKSLEETPANVYKLLVGVAPDCMHTLDKKEAATLKALLSHSERSYSIIHAGPVTNNPDELRCGWRAMRPRAEYDLTKVNKKRRPLGIVPNPGLFGVAQQTESQSTEYPYMSGQLDDKLSYVYRGGLSSKVFGDQKHHYAPPSQMYTHMPTYHRQAIVLDPVIPYRSAQIDRSTRAELADIVALQMKPELLVEQLIIENRLRTMSLNAFPILEGIGVDTRKTRFQSEPTYSFSSSVLPQNQHRKHKRRKLRSRAPLEWYSFTSTKHPGEMEFPATVQPFDSHAHGHRSGGLHGAMSSVKIANNGKGTIVENGATASSVPAAPVLQQYQLSVVAPSLETAVEERSKGRRYTRLNPLLH